MTDVDTDLWSALCQPPVLFTPKHVTRPDPWDNEPAAPEGGGGGGEPMYAAGTKAS